LIEYLKKISLFPKLASNKNGNGLFEQIFFVIHLITKARPAAVKGEYVKNCTISATMSPSVRVAV